MEQRTKAFIGIGILCIICIIIGITTNIFFTFTFSAYFIICVLSLLWCWFINDKALLILPWTITSVASVIITLNYLHPDISVYSNADYHVLVMQGMDKKDSVLLVGKNKTKSLFDKKDYEGFASITPKSSDSQNCILHYNLLSEPIFAKIDGSRTGRLINKGQLPSFHGKITLQNDSIICDIFIQTLEDKNDSTKVVVSFKHLSNNAPKEYEPSFRQPIHIGYDFYDILHSGTSYEESGEEELLNTLRKTTLVRNYDDEKQGVFYMTYPQKLKDVKLFCDGKLFTASNDIQEEELDKDTYYYIGIGSQATRPLKATSENGNISLRYQFPYINNFPGIADDAEPIENRQKVIAITSKTASLLKTNVSEAFYYPLFENEKNEYNFNGNVSYRINDSQTPFQALLNDYNINAIQQPSTLTSKNGAIWHFNVCNLRQSSPITGEDNIFVKDNTILLLVFGIIFLAFLYSMIFTNGHLSKMVMIVCLFAIPLFVIRIYLLWRIAVFPPVVDITLNEFLRYTMELPNLAENPVLITISLWVLMPLAALLLWGSVVFLSRFDEENKWYKIIFALAILLPLVIAVSIKVAHISIVGLNILVPVILYLIFEYIISRGLPVGYRIANALSCTVALLIADPGYAIMFFIFECIYYSILLYSYLKYRWYHYTQEKAAGFPLFVILLLIIVGMVISLPYLVWIAYNQEHFLGFISFSRAFFIILPLIVGGIIVGLTWLWKRYDFKWGGIIAISVWLLFTIGTATIGYNYFQTHNLHFKYRAIIHTQTVGTIMKGEMYDHENSQRLLNAAQNQWFLQYHINKGEQRFSDDGIMSLLPHFKKGVTWNTQISDVVLSRYVIGELSWLVPITMILLTLVLLWGVFRNENTSPAGRVITYAVALLFVVQSTFEWMAVTNRTVFFGQDFPFLSQNARCTLIMFVLWLSAFVVFACYQPEREYNDELEEGLNTFAKRKPQATFFLMFIAIGLIVYFNGNNYGKLYASDKVEGDKMNAEEFNLSTAMSKSKEELAEINHLLSQYPAQDRQLTNEEDISTLIKEINEKIHLDEYVNKLKDEGQINDFTYSLYQAFTNNLKRKNSNGNIIHLRHHDLSTFELALNDTYFSLQSPEFDKKAWKGNIYSEVSSPTDYVLAKEELPGMTIYSIPHSWLPPKKDYAIVDCRIKDGHIGENYNRFIHKEMADYTAYSAVFPISQYDFLELNDKKDKNVITYQYGREEQDILVKNIIINGKRRFFYPLKEKCLWLRNFSNFVAYSKQGTGSKDSVFVTLDYELTQNITDSLRLTGHECSVVAIDGMGNVRVMADNKLSGSIDPNDDVLIDELATQSYMNPNSTRDENLFGNLNLCYMRPGPGSSLKPITYAAVTSQSQDIDWAGLELMSPSHIKDTTVSKAAGKYYHVRKFGPQYKYSAERPFKSIAEDEKGITNNGIGWINNDFYLYRSSNYYNALITYLGHYDNLANAENQIFVVSSNANDFPRFRMKKGGRIYTFREVPQAKSNQILFDGLTKNFRIPTFTGFIDTLRFEFINPALYQTKKIKDKADISANYSWVFPQASTIYDYEMKESLLTPAERLRQYTLGASPVKVTPMKMAEMYGKLFSLHPDFHATVMPRKSKFTESWLDRNGNPSEFFLNFYKHNLYCGMDSCVKKGTAQNLTPLKGYHLYAKTGTLSIGNGIHDDRMLAVIICNRNIIADSDIQSSDDYKFMVVYFRFKQLDSNSKLFWDTVNAVNREIINSTSFINYMK